DARNDQNFIISQLAVTFVRLHNHLCDYYFSPSLTQFELFNKARRSLVLLYQAVLRYDYLPRIMDDSVSIESIEDGEFVFYNGGQKIRPVLSGVFTNAAFRFGHSQVRDAYKMSKNELPLRLYADNMLDLKGFVRDFRRTLDWRAFFKFEEGDTPQLAKAFDHSVASSLTDIPVLEHNKNSLIEINASKSSKLPSGLDFYNIFINLPAFKGQSVVSKIEDLITVENGQKMFDIRELPLWTYLLLEAEAINNGARLGPFGSTIIAEQFIWILLNDEISIINHKAEAQAIAQELFGNGFDITKIDITDVLSILPGVPASDEALNANVSSLIFNTSQNLKTMEYTGTELQQLTTNEFNTLKNRVSTEPLRLAILQNGFYDQTTPSGTALSSCIAGNNIETNLPARRGISMFVSRFAICTHAGIIDTHTNNTIKGVIFHFGLNGAGNMILMGRAVDAIGNVINSSQNLFNGTPSNILDETTFKTARCKYMCDGHQKLKTSTPLPTMVYESSKLLALIGENTPPLASTITFHIGAATGAEINQFSAFPNHQFFTLALESTVNGTQLLSDRHRPCPPECY
ncbi:MAG: hypothetical protein IT258_09630, partial [Saprospiraceae bacterium]|nr:hypothetical protein [Saprospiraceae bacterium]